MSLRLYFAEHVLASVARHESEQFLVSVFIPVYRKGGGGREGRKQARKE